MFKQRVISCVVLAIFLLVILIPGGYILAAASLALSLIAYRELMRALHLAGNLKKEEENCKRPNVIACFNELELFGYAGIIVYYLVMVFAKDRSLLLVTLFCILIAFMFLYVFSFPKYEAREIMVSFFALIYGPVMLTFMYLTRELEFGAYQVWMIFASSWVSDTCAYCVGMLIGKHKLAPVLSPKKSIEGAVGGVAGAAIVGFLFGHFALKPLMDVNNVAILTSIITGVGAVISQVGDLAASGIKRNEGIKDYGRLIPGHGGVMDRFDSVIFTAPMTYLLTLLLLKQMY